MPGEVQTISSNVTRLAIRRTGATSWLALRRVEDGDLGPEIEKEENMVIEPARNREKEIAVGVNAPGEFKLNFTPESLGNMADGLFLSRGKRTPEAGRRRNGTVPTVVATGFDVGEDAAAAGYLTNQLVFAEFFGDAGNNGLFVVTGTLANVVQVAGLTAEAAPPPDASIKVVGYRFADSDISMVAGSATTYPALGSAALAIGDTGLETGDWVIVGGTAATNRFTAEENNGLCRVRSADNGFLFLDLTSGGADRDTAPIAEAGVAGQQIDVFFSNRYFNVSALLTDFVQTNWDIERTLGQANPVSEPGIVQGEYVTDALLNTFTLPAPAKKKLEFDAQFIGRDGIARSGRVGDELLSDGDDILDELQADAFNSSSDVLRERLYIYPTPDDFTTVPQRLFRFVTEHNVEISNNAVVEDAHGVFGALDITPGDFTFRSEMTAHFVEVEAQKQIRADTDIGYQLAYVKAHRGRRAAVVFDCPIGSLGNSVNNVERNASIKTPLTFTGHRSPIHDYTASYSEFDYVPRPRRRRRTSPTVESRRTAFSSLNRHRLAVRPSSRLERCS